jgi:dipeptidyl-peptidase-4
MDISAFPAQLARTQRFTLGVPRAFTISPDGRQVLFLRSRGGEDRASCLWLLDGDTERLLVDPGTLGASGPVPPAERVRRERARERSTGIVAYAADAALSTAVFAVDGRLWMTRTAGGSPRLIPTAGPVVDPRPDPTGRRVAYVTGGALHVVELATSRDRQLAAPGHPDVTWGLAEHVAAEEMGRSRGYWWSPDGTRLLAARVDNGPVQRWWIADPAQPSQPPREIAYPAAGTANADVTLHVLGLDGSSVPVSWDHIAFEYPRTADQRAEPGPAHAPGAGGQPGHRRHHRGTRAVRPGLGPANPGHAAADRLRGAGAHRRLRPDPAAGGRRPAHDPARPAGAGSPRRHR